MTALFLLLVTDFDKLKIFYIFAFVTKEKDP